MTKSSGKTLFVFSSSLLCCCLTLLLPLHAFPQQTLGGITGTITETSPETISREAAPAADPVKPIAGLGVEAAGTIRQVGAAGSRFKPGDQVLTHSAPLRNHPPPIRWRSYAGPSSAIGPTMKVARTTPTGSGRKYVSIDATAARLKAAVKPVMS